MQRIGIFALLQPKCQTFINSLKLKRLICKYDKLNGIRVVLFTQTCQQHGKKNYTVIGYQSIFTSIGQYLYQTTVNSFWNWR